MTEFNDMVPKIQAENARHQKYLLDQYNAKTPKLREINAQRLDEIRRYENAQVRKWQEEDPLLIRQLMEEYAKSQRQRVTEEGGQ